MGLNVSLATANTMCSELAHSLWRTSRASPLDVVRQATRKTSSVIASIYTTRSEMSAYDSVEHFAETPHMESFDTYLIAVEFTFA